MKNRLRRKKKRGRRVEKPEGSRVIVNQSDGRRRGQRAYGNAAQTGSQRDFSPKMTWLLIIAARIVDDKSAPVEEIKSLKYDTIMTCAH